FQFFPVAAGDQGGQRDGAARGARQPVAGPDGAPGVTGDHFLELVGEVGGVRGGPGDVFGAKDLLADGQASVVAVAGEALGGAHAVFSAVAEAKNSTSSAE